MSFLPGIFGNKNAQQQPQQQQPASPQQQSQNQQVTGNSSGSGGPAQGQQSSGANSQMDAANPLDPFLALMTPSKEVLEAKAAKSQNTSLFGENFTPENIQKTVGSVNFTQGLDQAKVQAALGGDASAFMEVMNSVAQSAVSASVQMSHGMVEKGVATGAERFTGDLDSRFRDFTLRSQNVENPALQHPVGKALLSTVSKQIADANPKMSAHEVHQHATKMFGDFFKLGVSPTEAQQQELAKKSAGQDWMDFVDTPQQ